jgi:hypothetical protein
MKTPRWTLITLVSLAGCVWHLNGQTSIDLTRQGRLGSGTTLPAQCAAGQIFFKSNASAGANLYTCFAQNSWTAVGLTQGAAASRPVNCTFGQIWFSNDTNALTYCSATGAPGTWSPMLAGGGSIGQIDAAGAPLTVRPALNFGTGASCVDNSGANRTDCTFSGGGGGSGSVVLTSGTGAPSANCTAPSSINLAVYLDSTNQDQWWCSATNTWKKILSVTGSGPYGVIGGTGTAPSAPAVGSVSCYFDSTTGTQICLNSGGNAFTMTKGVSLVSHQFVTNVDAAGIQHLATIGATDVPATPVPAPGTSITLIAPRGYAICTGTCTVNVPAPVAGYEFCVLNDDNVASAITISALGFSAMYENTARTGYGTASTGTLTATAAAGNKVCILGRDSTHYLTLTSSGTWTAN